MEPSPSFPKSLLAALRPARSLLPSRRAISRGAALATLGISGLAFLGWIFGIDDLKSLLPGMSTMKANTSLGLFSAAFAAGFLVPSGTRRSALACRVIAWAVLLLGLLTLAEHLSGTGLGIDQLLLLDPGSGPHPGRMSPMSAVCFVLTGASILAAADRRYRLSQWSSVSLLLVSMVPVAGYVFNVSVLYRAPQYGTMALHTALAFHLLALALLTCSPDLPLIRLFQSRTAGGITVRRLLPLIPAVIIVLGWVSVVSVRSRMLDPAFAIAILVVLCVFFASGLVVWHANALNHIDEIRHRREEEIKALNEGLERAVEERTRELREALAHVRRLAGMLPMCAWCKKVRVDHKYWETVETYLSEHTDTRITHGICPDCLHTTLGEPGTVREPEKAPESGPFLEEGKTS